MMSVSTLLQVAQLSLASGQEVDPSQPYAELWMGTHPSGPSTLAEPAGAAAGEVATLGQLLARRPDLLGASAAEFGSDLPFLFKVLSVGTALSIQSHPNKALAERLHREQPEVSRLVILCVCGRVWCKQSGVGRRRGDCAF